MEPKHTPDVPFEQPIYCPECGMPAYLEDQSVSAGLVKVRCFARHWFLMLRERLDGLAA